MTKSKVINLKQKDFLKKKIINKKFKNKTGIIMFGVEWCGYCHQTKPVLEELSKISKHFIVGYLDCDKEPLIAGNLNISGYPTLMNVKKNGLLTEYNGPRDLTSLVGLLCKNLNNKNKICK